jgi:hypothetical protein
LLGAATHPGDRIPRIPCVDSGQLVGMRKNGATERRDGVATSRGTD